MYSKTLRIIEVVAKRMGRELGVGRYIYGMIEVLG